MATSDYPNCEDFVWDGIEQLHEIPEQGENQCPICMMSLVPGDSPATEDVSKHVTLRTAAHDSHDAQSSNRPEIAESHPNLSVATVHTSPATATIEGTSLQPDVEESPENGPFIRIRACSHVFHTKCLHTWLRVPKNKSCPMCRRVLFKVADSQVILDWEMMAELEARIVQYEDIQNVQLVRLGERFASQKNLIKQQKDLIRQQEEDLKMLQELYKIVEKDHQKSVWRCYAALGGFVSAVLFMRFLW